MEKKLNPHRVLILGCCGAGKSTLARQLAAHTSLPLIHLDQEYWLPGWQEPAKADWENKVSQLIQRDYWIMDGNYGGTIDLRLTRADTVIFLDYSRWICLYRVLKRIYQNYGKVRADLVEGCPERLDWSFLHYVLLFNTTRRPGILRKLASIGQAKNIWVIRNEKEYNTVFQQIESLEDKAG